MRCTLPHLTGRRGERKVSLAACADEVTHMIIRTILAALALATAAEAAETMSAIRVHERGGPEVLKLEQVTIPTPGEGEMLVRVHAAGVNPIDWKMRQGGGRARPGGDAYTPGFDVAGIVASVGPGVSKFK